MINLSNLDNSKLEIKNKKGAATISRSLILLNDFKIKGPGEYDIADIACDVTALDGHINALIEFEMILFGVIDAVSSPDTLNEDFTKVSVLILFVDSKDDLTKAASLVGQIEPQLVFYCSSDPQILQSIPTIEKTPSPFKLSRNDLVFEATRHIVLE